MQCWLTFISAAFFVAVAPQAADLAKHKRLVTSVRTGDPEVFIADPVTGDMFIVSRSP